MVDLKNLKGKKANHIFQPDEIKFLETIIFLDEYEPNVLNKILSIIAYINGLQDGHELYGKDKPISPIIKEIDDILEVQPVDHPEVTWGDIVRALYRRFGT